MDDIARARLRPPEELELLDDALTDEELLLLDRLELEAEAFRRRRSDRALRRLDMLDREQRSAATVSPASAAAKAAALSNVAVINIAQLLQRCRQRGSIAGAAPHATP